MKRKLYLLWLLLLAIPMYSQEVIVNGRIADAQTGENLYGANVYVPQLRKGTTSDELGKFKLQLPKGEKLKLAVSYVGYLSQTLFNFFLTYYFSKKHLVLHFYFFTPSITAARTNSTASLLFSNCVISIGSPTYIRTGRRYTKGAPLGNTS